MIGEVKDQRSTAKAGTVPDIDHFIAEMKIEKLPPLLSPRRIAGLLDMDKRRVYDLVTTGDLAAIRHGARGLRIFRQSLMDWLHKGGSTRGTHRETGKSD